MSNGDDAVSAPPIADTGAPGSAAESTPVDLDVLRGWSERRHPGLRQSHRLPALAELLHLDDRDRPVHSYSIHGPDLLLGRYQSRYAPVDVLFYRLRDHQTYELGAPHAHLGIDGGDWRLRVLSPRAKTAVDGESVDHSGDPVQLQDGGVVTLGRTRFRFRTTDVAMSTWESQRQKVLSRVDEPALFLKRRGGVCGPFCRVDDQRPVVIGRSHPAPGVLPNTDHWPDPKRLDWDLSGLYDRERRHVAFRHAVIELKRGRWMLRAISSRQRTFVNRIAATGAVALKSGDEIGLGSVLFRFHHPHRSLESSRPRHVPAVVDWSQGKPPSTPDRGEDASGGEIDEPED